MANDYITIKNDQSCEIVAKKSRFIATIRKVVSPENAVQLLDDIKKGYKDASHHTYAYKTNGNAVYQRYSDDGEPKGTAGLPILDVISHHKLENVLIVVTRYFGGTLLGTGGLVRAYSKAAAQVVAKAVIVNMMMCMNITLTSNYSLSGKIQNYLQENSVFIKETKFLENVIISVVIPLGQVEKVEKDIINLTSANCTINKGKKEYMEMEI